MAKIIQNKPIILASTSPLRRELLQSAGMSFDVEPSPFDEEAHKTDIAHLPIPQQALFLSAGKAQAVSALYPDHLVIAADQIGEFEGRPLFKPHTRERAIAMLMAMQSNTHYQHCAATVYADGVKLTEFIDTVAMSMRVLSASEIAAYIDMDKPLDCCGSYRYEGLGKFLFSYVDGSYESVLGLPLLKLLNYLQDSDVLRLV